MEELVHYCYLSIIDTNNVLQSNMQYFIPLKQLRDSDRNKLEYLSMNNRQQISLETVAGIG